MDEDLWYRYGLIRANKRTDMKTDIQEIERVFKALANRRRILIVKYLHRTERAVVGAIAKEIKLSFKATSKHLIILSAANVVEKEQIGLTMEYHLSSPVPLIVKTMIGSL